MSPPERGRGCEVAVDIVSWKEVEVSTEMEAEEFCSFVSTLG